MNITPDEVSDFQDESTILAIKIAKMFADERPAVLGSACSTVMLTCCKTLNMSEQFLRNIQVCDMERYKNLNFDLTTLEQ